MRLLFIISFALLFDLKIFSQSPIKYVGLRTFTIKPDFWDGCQPNYGKFKIISPLDSLNNRTIIISNSSWLHNIKDGEISTFRVKGYVSSKKVSVYGCLSNIDERQRMYIDPILFYPVFRPIQANFINH